MHLDLQLAPAASLTHEATHLRGAGTALCAQGTPLLSPTHTSLHTDTGVGASTMPSLSAT